jgi:TPP-dependent 2-oxoacid decarboxylase
MAEITVGSYLFTRLKQLGLQTVFGVPGGKSYNIHETSFIRIGGETP